MQKTSNFLHFFVFFFEILTTLSRGINKRTFYLYLKECEFRYDNIAN